MEFRPTEISSGGVFFAKQWSTYIVSQFSKEGWEML